MRPRIVEWLSGRLGADAAGWLVPSPATVYVLAMLAVLALFVRRCGRVGLPREAALGLAFWGMCGGLVGARLFFLIQHLGATVADPASALDVRGGTASWGAYLGGTAALLVYAARRRLPALRFADVAFASLGLGIAIGRWSCFLNGDDYGTASTLPWAVRYPHASPPFVAQVRAGLLDPLADLSRPLHPVQLYLSLNGLVLFWLTSRFWARFRERPGATACIFWLAYATSRFAWEALRGDQQRVLGGSLTVPQLLALLVAAPAAWGLWRAMRGAAPDGSQRNPEGDGHDDATANGKALNAVGARARGAVAAGDRAVDDRLRAEDHHHPLGAPR